MSLGRPRKQTFQKGDVVSARWSGSKIFYDAKVLEVTTKTYKVQFDDGSISSLKLADVKKVSTSQEPSPKAGPSKSRSRSRSAPRATKSLSRSRSRSPARKAKKTSLPKEEKKPKRQSKKKSDESKSSNSISKDETDSIKKTPPLTEKVVLSESRQTWSPKVILSNSFRETITSYQKHESSTERPSRAAGVAALKSIQLQSASNARNLLKSKYSDAEEEEEEEEKKEVVPTIANLWKIVFFFGTLFKAAFLSTILLFVVFACTKKQCSVLNVPQFYSRWRDVGNSIKYPMAGIVGYHLLHALLSLVPLGKKVAGFSGEGEKSPFEYRLNGIFILLLQILVFGICSYFGVSMNWGYDKFRPIAFSAAIYCLISAIILHIYSCVKGDGTAQTKVPLLGKFYNGSYANPVLFGKLDIKTSFIRAGLMGAVLLNLSILLKYFLMRGYVTVPFALTSGMQLFFVLDLFFREESLLSTATYTTDTIGYAFILTTGFLIPIGLSFENVYLFNYEAKASHIPHWCSGAIVCLFLAGYYVYLTSTSLKHNFRRNPFCPSLSDVESIPTSKKKRLIASGLWGRVRHPNYMGLLIMAIAWTLPCGFAHFAPYAPLVLLTIALIVRSFRVEVECQEKYGPAWNNYIIKVRSRLVPYVF